MTCIVKQEKSMRMTFALLFCLFSLISCSESSEFATPPDTTTVSVSSLNSYSYDSCALEANINPKVNILYLIDNSTSTNLLSDKLKKAITDSVYFASKTFDYRIYVAPLIKPEGGDNFAAYPAFSGTPTGSTAIPQGSSQMIDSLTFKNPAFGSTEKGVSRMIELINYNHNMGHFRNDSNTVTVIISNGDDNEIAYNPAANVNQFEQKLNELKALKQKYDTTGKKQFRLVSFVPQSYCKVGYVIGRQYREMAKRLYGLYGDGTQSVFFPDNFDLCPGDFPNIFSQINTSINPIKEKLTYAHWPIDKELEALVVKNQINLANLEVSTYTVSTETRTQLVQGADYNYNNAFNGSLLAAGQVNDLTHSGHALNLNSPKSRISTPDCISIVAPEYKKYYGYIPVAIKPLKESIQLTINGRNITESAKDGWELVSAYQPSLNVLVPPTPAHINDLKSGYMLKLNGSAIYQDGASVQLTFKKSPDRE